MSDITSWALNWIGQVNWVLSLFMALIISIIANLLTPKIKNTMAEYSESSAKTRIEEVEQEFNYVKELYNDRNKLYHNCLKSIFKILMYFGFGAAIILAAPLMFELSGSGSIFYLIGMIFYVFGIAEARIQIKRLTHIINFRDYEGKVQLILGRLEIKSKDKKDKSN